MKQNHIWWKKYFSDSQLWHIKDVYMTGKANRIKNYPNYDDMIVVELTDGRKGITDRWIFEQFSYSAGRYYNLRSRLKIAYIKAIEGGWDMSQFDIEPDENKDNKYLEENIRTKI